MSAPALSADRLSVTTQQGRVLVSDICLTLQPGELAMLVGPNGAGKTSLMRALAGVSVETVTGGLEIMGAPLARLRADERARRIAYLPQNQRLVWPQPVRDIVALGRFSYGARPGRLAAPDRLAVDHALGACGLEALAGRAADTLSGGEQARMHIARVLCAETPIVLADEPSAALDARASHEAIRLFRRAATERGAAVLLAVHDLHLAAAYADRIIWLKDGHLVADGPPHESMTAQRLGEIFGLETAIAQRAGRPVLEVIGPL